MENVRLFLHLTVDTICFGKYLWNEEKRSFSKSLSRAIFLYNIKEVRSSAREKNSTVDSSVFECNYHTIDDSGEGVLRGSQDLDIESYLVRHTEQEIILLSNHYISWN